jgi:hypothetical protein
MGGTTQHAIRIEVRMCIAHRPVPAETEESNTYTGTMSQTRRFGGRFYG